MCVWVRVFAHTTATVKHYIIRWILFWVYCDAIRCTVVDKTMRERCMQHWLTLRNWWSMNHDWSSMNLCPSPNVSVSPHYSLCQVKYASQSVRVGVGVFVCVEKMQPFPKNFQRLYNSHGIIRFIQTYTYYNISCTQLYYARIHYSPIEWYLM